MEGIKQTIYGKDYKKGENQEELYLKREDEQIMGKDKMNIMDQYQSEAHQQYNLKDSLKYKQQQDDKLIKYSLPSLIKNSEYGMGFIRFKQKAKADLLRQEHKVIQNTKIIGKSRTKQEYRSYDTKDYQKHHN